MWQVAVAFRIIRLITHLNVTISGMIFGKGILMFLEKEKLRPVVIFSKQNSILRIKFG
jgi:hypothetical protein